MLQKNAFAMSEKGVVEKCWRRVLFARDVGEACCKEMSETSVVETREGALSLTHVKITSLAHVRITSLIFAYTRSTFGGRRSLL